MPVITRGGARSPELALTDAVSDFTTFTAMAHSGRDRLIAVSA